MHVKAGLYGLGRSRDPVKQRSLIPESSMNVCVNLSLVNAEPQKVEERHLVACRGAVHREERPQ